VAQPGQSPVIQSAQAAYSPTDWQNAPGQPGQQPYSPTGWQNAPGQPGQQPYSPTDWQAAGQQAQPAAVPGQQPYQMAPQAAPAQAGQTSIQQPQPSPVAAMTAEPTEKPKKSVFKQWWFWLLFLVLGGIIAGVVTIFVLGIDLLGGFVTPSSSPTTTATSAPPSMPPDPATALSLDDGWMLDTSGVMPVVNGYVTNNTGQDYDAAISITFDAYDAAGGLVGACADVVSSIPANSQWQFSATCSSFNITSVVFNGIIGY